MSGGSLLYESSISIKSSLSAIIRKDYGGSPETTQYVLEGLRQGISLCHKIDLTSRPTRPTREAMTEKIVLENILRAIPQEQRFLERVLEIQKDLEKLTEAIREDKEVPFSKQMLKRLHTYFEHFSEGQSRYDRFLEQNRMGRYH